VSTATAMAQSRPSRLLALGALLKNIFSFPAALGSLLVFVSCMWSRSGALDPDTWWHARVGEQILRTHQWPQMDVFSFTMRGAPWIAYEWLGEAAIALSARYRSLQGETLLLMFFSSALVLLLYAYAYLRSGHAKAAFVACALVLAAIAPSFTLRPQLPGYIFLLLTMIALERYRQGSRKEIWFLPLLFVVWVNVHGTFVLGLGVLGLGWLSGLFRIQGQGLVAETWTAAQRRELLLVLLLCVAVLPLTPYGTRLATYPAELVLSQPLNTAKIQEWQPLGFDLYLGRYLLVLLLLFFSAQAFLRPRYRLNEIVLLSFSIFAACVHVRFILFFLLVFTPMLAEMLAHWVPPYERRKDRWIVNAVLIAGLAIAAALFFPSARTLDTKVAERYPRGAVEYLQQHPVTGNLLNEYGWGGYLIWRQGQKARVFVDGRTDIYEYGGVLADYLHITLLEPDALSLLRKYDIRGCLLARKSPLATMLRALPGWEVAYADDLSAVLILRPVVLGNRPGAGSSSRTITADSAHASLPAGHKD
jgi:hypothetical protein